MSEENRSNRLNAISNFIITKLIPLQQKYEKKDKEKETKKEKENGED